jgi:hypothetical protein
MARKLWMFISVSSLLTIMLLGCQRDKKEDQKNQKKIFKT